MRRLLSREERLVRVHYSQRLRGSSVTHNGVGGWGQEAMIESIIEDINNISTQHRRHKFNS